MGFYHFHLGEKFETAGHAERTNDMLFARVNREDFTAIGLFNHSVFERTGDEEMSAERKRLWNVFDMHTSRGVPPGSVVISSLIATSGHPIHVVRTAQEYSRIIYDIDSKFDDPSFAHEVYGRSKVNVPAKVKFEWALNFSDLGIHEARSNHLFVLRRGFN